MTTIDKKCSMCGRSYNGMRSSQYCYTCSNETFNYNNYRAEAKKYWRKRNGIRKKKENSNSSGLFELVRLELQTPQK